MKAFLAKSIFTRRDKDVLILAKTKKAAQVEFKMLQHDCIHKTKDFKEVAIKELEVFGLDMHGRNYNLHKTCDTPSAVFTEPHYQTWLENMVTPDTITIAEDEATYQEMIELFKQQNQAMLLYLFY